MYASQSSASGVIGDGIKCKINVANIHISCQTLGTVYRT
jgi:hypothetical protein